MNGNTGPKGALSQPNQTKEKDTEPIIRRIIATSGSQSSGIKRAVTCEKYLSFQIAEEFVIPAIAVVFSLLKLQGAPAGRNGGNVCRGRVQWIGAWYGDTKPDCKLAERKVAGKRRKIKG